MKHTTHTHTHTYNYTQTPTPNTGTERKKRTYQQLLGLYILVKFLYFNLKRPIIIIIIIKEWKDGRSTEMKERVHWDDESIQNCW